MCLDLTRRHGCCSGGALAPPHRGGAALGEIPRSSPPQAGTPWPLGIPNVRLRTTVPSRFTSGHSVTELLATYVECVPASCASRVASLPPPAARPAGGRIRQSRIPAVGGCRRWWDRRNPSGWADPRRRAAWLVARVPAGLVRRAPRAWRGSPLRPARPRGFMKPVLSIPVSSSNRAVGCRIPSSSS